MRAVNRRDLLKAGYTAPFALIESSMAPVMQYTVPRVKLGVFADLAKFEMSKLKDPSPDAMREAMTRVWDTVDNRMGQMTYDNMFMNRTLKDVTMLAVRSMGWNAGDIREIGGGVLDTAKGAKGTGPLITHRNAYIAGLVINTALTGAIYGYMHGHPPQELRDYFQPKNEQGKRVNFPSYIKDIIGAIKDPGHTLSAKLHPLLSVFAQMVNNEDYYHGTIRNREEPVVQQMIELRNYLIQQMVPFGWRKPPKDVITGEGRLEQQLGIIPISDKQPRKQAPSKYSPDYTPRAKGGVDMIGGGSSGSSSGGGLDIFATGEK